MTAAECPNCRCRDMGGAGVYEPAQADQWCRSETCRYRHWTSGSMPTHKMGHDCPTEQGCEIEASMPPTDRERNTHRDYELSPMRWVVIELINGDTDWYDIAAFAYESEALAYRNRHNHAMRSNDYEVRPLGREYTS